MDHPVTAAFSANIPYAPPLGDRFTRRSRAGLVQVNWTVANQFDHPRRGDQTWHARLIDAAIGRLMFGVEEV